MYFTHKVLCTICQEKTVERAIRIKNPVCYECKMLRNKLRTKRVRDSVVKKPKKVVEEKKPAKLCMVCKKQVPKYKSAYCSLECSKS